MAAVHISTEDDGKGNATAVGSVTIVNTGSYEITDFHLTLKTNGLSTPLIPFEGNLSYPMQLANRHIPPHGQLQTAVMSTATFPSADVSAKSVTLDAVFEKSESIATDHVDLQ